MQWFGLRGRLHGLAPHNQPKAEFITVPYSKAHTGHAAQLDQPLDEALRARWQKIAPLPNAAKPKTRREWIVAAYRARTDFR